MSIQFTKKEMQEMENLISTFFKMNKTEQKIPVDIFETATALGFDVRGAAFESKLEGILVVNESVEKIYGFNSNKLIAYNCAKDIYSKKFIVAHELAHYINEKKNAFDKKIVVAARDHSDSYSENKKEQQMDYIAAALLIPKNSLFDFLQKHPNAKKEQIAMQYKVSNELAERRLDEIREISKNN